MDKPGGFLGHLLVSHVQYMEGNGSEPFSHRILTPTLMEYFVAGHLIFSTKYIDMLISIRKASIVDSNIILLPIYIKGEISKLI